MRLQPRLYPHPQDMRLPMMLPIKKYYFCPIFARKSINQSNLLHNQHICKTIKIRIGLLFLFHIK